MQTGLYWACHCEEWSDEAVSDVASVGIASLPLVACNDRGWAVTLQSDSGRERSMVTESKRRDSACVRGISRRHFIKLAAAAGLMAGCAPAPQPAPTRTGEPAVTTGVAAATDTPAPASSPTATAAPTSTPAPTPTPPPKPTPAHRPAIIQFYPDVPSKVVQVHHAGVWEGDELVPGALRQMLDASIVELTGLGDAREAWAALFSANERIAIKVNTIHGREGSEVWTHVPLAMAVAESLQEMGVPAEQIVIFDRDTDELESAGYPINRDGPGVRCYGTDRDYLTWDRDHPTGWKVAGLYVQLSRIFLECDALINIPVLKAHGRAGLTFGMKNHYGTFNRPQDFHENGMMWRGIVGLNALPPIRNRARLVIGDALWAALAVHTSIPWWTLDAVGDSILISFDPVAHDTVGLQVLSGFIKANGGSSTWASHLADLWLQNAAAQGLGTNDPAHMDLAEIELG